jgi:glycerol-3-phosphate dehydrogenase
MQDVRPVPLVASDLPPDRVEEHAQCVTTAFFAPARRPPSALVIGAGSTGSAVAHDLALRGFTVTVVERGEIGSGTTGRNHGLLHSGARYAVKDPEAAAECIDERDTLARIAPEVLELNGGLFVGIGEAAIDYRERFLDACRTARIPVRELTPAEAMNLEPALNPALIGAIEVPDGVFDPLHLCLAFLATAVRNGAAVYPYHEVEELVVRGSVVEGAQLRDRCTGERRRVESDIVVNATGPWADRIAGMAGLDVPVTPTAGVMVAVLGRLVDRVINRLEPPSDGDIVLPQRRTVVIGTSSWAVSDPDRIAIPAEHVALMFERGRDLVPGIDPARQRGVFAVARPLIGRPGDAGRELSRTFECFDHATDGVEGFVTISGGKTTTARAMAEKTANVVCAKLGVDQACHTREVLLASYREYRHA